MRSNLKVMLLFDTSTKSGRALLAGISKYANFNSLWELWRIPLFYWGPVKKKKSSAFPDIENVDGLIIGDVEKTKEKIIPNLPTVVLSENTLIPNIPNIVTESEKIGNMAAEYLIGLGYNNFAYCGFNGIPWSDGRKESFCKRIAQAGFETNVYRPSKLRAGISWQKEKPVMADWLKSLTKPKGLLACNDDRGLQVFEACKLAGLNIPEDMAVLGVDNDEVICDLCSPTLTSIDLNFERAGYDAANLLNELMTGKKISRQHIVVPTKQVVQRNSTGTLVIEDYLVANAVNFIRKNATRPIKVSEVVAELPTSRRVLERRFRNELGRSILSEIRRTRKEIIIRMLLESNLSASQIASKLNFSDASHLGRFFRSMERMSMLEYRKKFGAI